MSGRMGTPVTLRRGWYSVPVQERIMARVFEGFNVQVNIQVGPMKMTRVNEEYIVDFRDFCFTEPRKLFKGKKILLPTNEDPDTVF